MKLLFFMINFNLVSRFPQLNLLSVQILDPSKMSVLRIFPWFYLSNAISSSNSVKFSTM
jgi:hypothetical protein